MNRDIEEFLTKTVRRLIEGDVGLLLKTFRTPVPIFHPDGVEVLTNEVDLRDAGEQLIASYRRLNIRSVSSKMLDEISKPTLETTGYLMEFRYLNKREEEVRKTVAWYFLEPFDDSYLVVMVDFRQTAIPEFFSEFRKVIPLRPTDD